MSTRVHELAKELGLKSQELLDCIQKWDLPVKGSALAAVEPSMVERIRQLMNGSSPEAPAVPAVAPPTRPSPSETPAIRSTTGTTAPKPAAPSPPPPPAAAPVKLAPTPAPPSGFAGPGLAAPPSEAAAPLPPAPMAPPSPAAPHVSPPLAARAPSTAPPVTRTGGLTAPPRSGGGPLSGHTPHRGSSSAGGASRPAPSQATLSGPAAPAPPEPRPRPSTPPPLRPSDYISPAGLRSATGRVPSLAPAPRPREDSAGGERRDARDQGGTRRPLPSVAAAQAPSAPPRRPSSPPGGGRGPGGAPESRAQRPEKRYTADEMRAMMQSGPLGTQAPSAPPASGRPGALSGRPGGPPRPASSPSAGGALGRPAGPPGAALRRPGEIRPALGPAPVAPPALSPEEEEERKGKGAASRLGTAADRAGRRAKRNERASERRVTSPVPAAALLGESEEENRRSRGGRKAKGGHRVAVAPSRKSHAQIEPPVSVRNLSEAIGIKTSDLLRRLMNQGQMVSINSTLEDESAQLLALDFGVELEIVYERTAEDDLLDSLETTESAGEGLVHRPPIITILGHVDHGKTSLLDRIRKANVVATESGGITQHIGAYQVQHDGKPIAFVDTPGHEAFTAMRARGANVTDIVVLVVAADDGVMPQTREAIDHAKAADVPIVVALNKIDLPNVDTVSNVNKIFGELAQQGLNPEEWGGDVPVVKTSTVTGQGIDDLLATLDAVAELHELKANPDRPASGTCLEASISEGRGVVATVLVQDGTLRVGDVIVCGDGFGRVRALFNDKGQSVAEAGPSTPVEISGLDAVPTAGEKFAALDDITRARSIAETRRLRARGTSLGERQTVTLENLYTRMAEQKVKTLNLILKADVQGSLEALIKELEKLENDEVPIRVLLKGVGGISESDVLLADASQAIIIGFRVAPEDRALSQAEEKKIDIRRYDIIYQVTDEIKKAVEGMLVPETKEVHLGRAVVRQVFKITKIGTVAGCFVTQGTIERGSKARIIREGREIYKGTVDALKRFKDDVKEVAQNFECGIKISNFDDLKLDDVIEAYRIDIIRRTL